MGAIKSNIRKVLAAFLCACLLVTYNPAVGSTGTAFADEGGVETYAVEQDGHLENIQNELNNSTQWEDIEFNNGVGGEAVTNVNVRTYEGGMEVACGGSTTPIAATLQELKDGKVGNKDVSSIWFEATGGTPGSNPNDPYNASWTILDNGIANPTIVNWFKTNGLTGKLDGSVAKYSFDIQKYANNNGFVAEHTYTFIGKFTDTKNESMSCQVVLYVLPNGTSGGSIPEFKWGVIPAATGNTDLNNVEVVATRAEGTTLIGGKNVPASVTEAMQNKAATDTVDPNTTGDYTVGDVLALNVSPATVLNASGMSIPSFLNNNMEVRLPIADKYLTGDGAYKEDDTIKVLWTSGAANNIHVVNAVVKKNPTGTQAWAELVYPFSGSTNADGIDSTGAQALPGFFAIEYNTAKLPSGDPEKDTTKYFGVTVNVDNGTVMPAEKRYWKVGATNGDDLARFALTPMEGYGLHAATLTNGTITYDFINDAAGAEAAGKLETYQNQVTLTNSKDVFAANSEWTLNVEFTKKEGGSGGGGGGDIDPVNPPTRMVTITTTGLSGAPAEIAGVVLQYKEDGFLKSDPENGKPATSKKVILPINVPVDVSIINSGVLAGDGVTYQASKIEMNGVQQVLTKLFTIPATPSGVDEGNADVTLNITFDAVSSAVVPTPITYKVAATVDSSSADLGEVASITPTTYGDDVAPGSIITFQGKASQYYVSDLDVKVGNNAPTRITVNPTMQSNFAWNMPNYHADVSIVAYFSDKSSPSIELTLANDGHGKIVPLGSEASAQQILMVQSGERFPLNFVADEGYELDKVTLKNGSNEATEVEQGTNTGIVGTIWRDFIPTDPRSNTEKDSLWRITVTATFKEKSNGGGSGGDDTKPEAPQQVNVYVADPSLNDPANPNLAYLFNPPAESGVTAAEIAVADYSDARGVVNGKKSVIDSVKYGEAYPLTLKGNTLSVGNGMYEAYGIEKVLVVSYGYAADADGNQVKKGLKWTLYNWTMPYFELPKVLSNTDVIVYFGKVQALAPTTNPFTPENPIEPDPNGPGGGYVEKDFVNVTVTTNGGSLVSPGTNTSTPVLKGGQLPMTFTLESATHELESATYTPEGGSERSILDTLNAAAEASGSKTVSYLLQSIMVNTAVKATYKKKETPTQPVFYKVNSDVAAKYVDGYDVVNEKAASIMVGAGLNYTATSAEVTSTGFDLAQGSNLRFTLQRGALFKLQDASFTWDTSGVYAYVVDAVQDDGSVKRTVHFTTSADDLIGKKAYTSGTDLFGGDGAPDQGTAVLYADNLQCPITVKANYEKQTTVDGEPVKPEKPGDDDDDIDPDDPNHPDNPNNPDNSWAITTTVGTGLGQILTDSPNFNGSTTRVLKNSVTIANPLTITMVPETGFRISKVHVTSSTGDAVADFWTNVFGWINGKNDMLNKMEADAIANGYIKMKNVTQNFDITVDFAPIDEEYDPQGPLANQVAVNVVYDPARGSVTPNEGLTTTKDGKKQFTASPVKVGDKFFSVTGVNVKVGDKTTTVQAIDKGSNLVHWGSVYYNVFTVDFSNLTWPSDDPLAAVTVEVLFSQSPDTPGTGSVSPGTPDPTNPTDPNDPNNPNGPSVPSKEVTVNVVTEGTPEAGNNGASAIVSPRGTFTVVGEKDANGVMYAEQVKVSPLSGYEVSKIETVRNGDTNDAASFRYMQELGNTGSYFTVSAEPNGTEEITIYLAQKPLSERSYTVEVRANGVTGADQYVTPYGTVTLNQTASQTFSIDPAENVQVQRVVDEYSEDGGKTWHALTDEGVGYTRQSSDKNAVKGITVSPIKKKGNVVDRRITVTFQNSPNTNHTLPEGEKTNIQVQAFGPGAAYVTFDPNENQNGVWKGTEKTPVTYNYRYTLSDEAISQGYAIYRVQVNGGDLFEASDVSELVFEGEYAFTYKNMREGANATNTLFVYVKQFTNTGPNGNGGGNGGGNGDNDPSNPNAPLDPVAPDPSNAVTVEYGCGDGGSIAVKTAQGSAKALDTKGMKSVQVDKDELFTVVMTPDSSHVMSAVYLNNCTMREFNWVAPGDGRTAKVALEYTLEIDDPDMPARVFAVFKTGSNNTFKPWNANQIANSSFATDSKFRVEISPAIGVEALVEILDDGSMPAGDMLSMQEPVAPFNPEVTSTDDDGYLLEYDTISKLSNGKNVRILVGPLIKWEDDTLYSLDKIEGLQDGYTVVEKPMTSKMLSARSSLAAAGDEVDAQADKQRYYTYYEITGKLPDTVTSEQAEDGTEEIIPVIHLSLRELSKDDGLFPEYRVGDIEVPLGSVLVNASVTTSIGSGTITPVAVPGTNGTPWFGNNTTGPWVIPADTKIAFKVEPAEGFVLDSLAVNDRDASEWFDSATNTLTLTPSGNLSIVARFVSEDSAEAMRTVTVEVVNAYGANTPHGTTDPAPGVRQVKKGTPFAITFQAEQTPVRYVPYYIWISGDNMESYEGTLSPTQSGWILPASWNNQTIRVQYAPEGTTPSGANQLVSTFKNLTDQVGASLVKTGDNPWLPVIVLLLLLAGGAAFGAKRFLGASETASRAAKYSVTKRVTRRDERDKR